MKAVRRARQVGWSWDIATLTDSHHLLLGDRGFRMDKIVAE